jgi:hypothetical protein
MSETDGLVLRVSSFELNRATDHPNSNSEVSGIFEVGEGYDSLEVALKELIRRDDVDKVILVYRNYEFHLLGVSLTGDNRAAPSVAIKKGSFKFTAKDVKLNVCTDQEAS